MTFGNTGKYAAYNAAHSLTPLVKANRNIKRYTKKLANLQGSNVKANDRYDNLLNNYYNDLSYSRNARINALDTPESGDIWSSPEAAQSYYWDTTGARKIKSLKNKVQKAVNDNANLASKLSEYQNLLEQSEQNKSYAVQQKMQMENIFSGIFESFLGILGAGMGFLM